MTSKKSAASKRKLPRRPAHVPAEAVFKDDEWEIGPKDARGNPVGEWTFWWGATGDLCCKTIYKDKNNFDFVRYHPDGTYSQKGTYRNGKETGITYLQKSKSKTAELALTEAMYSHVFRVTCETVPGKDYVFQYFDENDVRVDLSGEPSLTPQDFAKNFSGLTIPAELSALLELQANYGPEAYAGFSLERDDKGLLKIFSKKKPFLDALMPFACANGTGSCYAFWNAARSTDLKSMPIVVFGDEGGEHVVAENVKALLTLLSADIEPSVWNDGVTFSAEDKAPGYGIKAYRSLIRERFGIAAAKNPKKIVDAAQKKHQAAFVAWLERFK
jgi:hypothetical protein